LEDEVVRDGLFQRGSEALDNGGKVEDIKIDRALAVSGAI
jgi:hypothetical protein